MVYSGVAQYYLEKNMFALKVAIKDSAIKRPYSQQELQVYVYNKHSYPNQTLHYENSKKETFAPIEEEVLVENILKILRY